MNRQPEIIELLLNDVLQFHIELTEKYRMEPGIHDMNLLQSAVNAPFQIFGGADLYPTVYDKAARLCYGLAKNHPFSDGNKRTAVHTMLVYLYINDILLEYSQIDLENVIIAIADGSMKADELADWIKKHVSKQPLQD